MRNKNFILHLTLIKDIGPHVIQKIIQRSDVQASDLYHLSVADWMKFFGVTENAAQKLVTGLSDVTILEKELGLIEKHTIQWVTILDDLYPALLKEIHLPPMVLYYQGSNFQDNPSIHLPLLELRQTLPTSHKASSGTAG